jgi:hypothetical protein
MHRNAAYAIFNMSASYAYRDDLKKAEELGVEALGIFEEILGRDHKDTIMARYEFANTRKKIGKH